MTVAENAIPVLICLPLLVWGVVLISSTRLGRVPPWLAFWNRHTCSRPLGKDTRFDEGQRTNLDGIYFVVVGILWPFSVYLLVPVGRALPDAMLLPLFVGVFVSVFIGSQWIATTIWRSTDSAKRNQEETTPPNQAL